jgi:hypothetical protein
MRESAAGPIHPVRRMAGCLATLATLATGAAAPAAAQASAGAHVVPLVTHVSPILQGRSMTEAYLTQPTLLAELRLAGGALRLQGAVSLEALTIGGGELGAGSYGEGYVDRRHPHTYLHELAASLVGDAGRATFSATAGRGFVPFGTDDPMSRPFVKFPVNHHLGQILERLVLIGGVRGGFGESVPGGAVMMEGALFNGNEPLDARDLGSLRRFGDSWAARLTLMPATGLELQASHAWVTSPEMPAGGAHDHRKWSVSARLDRPLGVGGVTKPRIYALAEWKRTAELDDGTHLYSFGSLLAEAALELGGWRPAVRLERSERPEEQRTFDPFRSAWPHMGAHGMGLTRWTIGALRLERGLHGGPLHVAPFVEASLADVKETAGGLFEPERFYGGRRITTLNVGARIGAGVHRPRMGRYGVAEPVPAAAATAQHHH